jgi:3-isopropylmalate/(R)-2-methylmalate dehydratase small subunit
MRGKAHVYHVDNIDTDRIIPGKYTKTLDLSQLAAHCMEDLDPHFSQKVGEGDFLVAGENFGCGSSREQAPVALKSAGVAVVLARSFARIFFRNAINIGLTVLEVPDHSAQDGDILHIDFEAGIVINETRNERYQATRLPAVMMQILQAGGLVAYLTQYGDYPNTDEGGTHEA